MQIQKDQLRDFLLYLYDRYQGEQAGEVASYIPELALANPDQFAISITLVNGETISVGDDEALFTIQSVSKPFTYAHALELFGEEQVMKYVGVEPTGEEYNSVIKLERSPKPLNAMVNAGSLSVAGMLSDHFRGSAVIELCSFFSKFAERSLQIDRRTYLSELETGDRNRALAYILKYKGLLLNDVSSVLDLYFNQCSLAINARDLSMMGSVLACQGVHPLTKERLLGPETVQSTLSVMLSCGMYNYSGHWIYEIGLPAKSGVSGALLMVVPNLMSVAVFSPRVDEMGSSLRAIKVCRELSHQLGLHLLNYQ